jgi:formylglycine-generating enzyme
MKKKLLHNRFNLSGVISRSQILLLPLIFFPLILLSCSKPKLESPFDPNVEILSPSNLDISQISVVSCKLTWSDNSSNEQGFRIDCKKDNEAWQVGYSEVEANITELIEHNLEANSTYYYRVYGFSDENMTSSLEGNINMNFPAPSNLNISQLSVSSCTLTWTDNSNGEDGFRIDCKKDNEAWQIGYSEVEANMTEFDDSSLSINSVYIYRVYGFAGDNTSTILECFFDNTFSAPTNLTYTIENILYLNADIHLDWFYSIGGIDGFKIKKNGTILQTIIPIGTTDWTDVGANIENSNSYQVLAFYQGYNSAYSNEVIFEIPEGMIYVQGGTFEMGDHINEGQSDELPVHDVTLASFLIGQYEVTQSEYASVVGSNPSFNYGVGDNYPVYYVSWSNAVSFCNLKSQQEGLAECYDLNDWSCDFDANGYRLPTEAEWEYAARGGINWQDNLRYSGCHNESDLINYAWYSSNSNGQSHEVGTKLPNQLDIHDMSGNIWEWCNDWYEDSYYSNGSSINPTGPASGNLRVLRGCGWSYYAVYCRVASRYNYNPTYATYSNGFRIVRKP